MTPGLFGTVFLNFKIRWFYSYLLLMNVLLNIIVARDIYYVILIFKNLLMLITQNMINFYKCSVYFKKYLFCSCWVNCSICVLWMKLIVLSKYSVNLLYFWLHILSVNKRPVSKTQYDCGIISSFTPVKILL